MRYKARKHTLIVGVDEAGRGPLAGPVAVGVAVVSVDFDWNVIPGVNDSKKVTPSKRNVICARVEKLKKDGVLDYAVALVSENVIDQKGITNAIKIGIARCFKKLALHPNDVSVKLDGLLRAPEEFQNQKTIVGGDGKERVIGLASILAKVTRDRAMERYAKKYPEYKFEKHKGYGTKIHQKALQEHGLSPIHRHTFCHSQ